MTEITKDYIDQQIANIQRQRADSINIVLQADVALLVYQDLLNKIDQQPNAIAAPVPAETPAETPAEERPVEAPAVNPDATDTTEGETQPE